MVSILKLVNIVFFLGQENGVSYLNIARHNGESYDLRTNYQPKITEVFQEPSEYFINSMKFLISGRQ